MHRGCHNFAAMLVAATMPAWKGLEATLQPHEGVALIPRRSVVDVHTSREHVRQRVDFGARHGLQRATLKASELSTI
jgi:hypothetical protein